MVLVKATFQNVVRRFSNPDGAVFDDLRKKLLVIFPELKGTVPDSLVLYYRDPDSDLVAISSDEELHTAEQLVGDDNTLKLLVGVTDVQEEDKCDEEADIDLFDLLHSSLFNRHPLVTHHSSLFGGDPFTSSIGLFNGPTWSDCRRILQQQEEHLRKRREYEERMRKAHLEHLKEMKEKAKRVEEERRKKGAEIKKKCTEIKLKEGSEMSVPQFPPGWIANPFGSWKPVVYQSPCGSSSCVWGGPWGYTAYYGENKEQEQEKKENAKQNKNDESTPQEYTEQKTEA